MSSAIELHTLGSQSDRCGVNVGIDLYEIAIPSDSRVACGRSMPFIGDGFAPHLLLRPLLTTQLGVESTRLSEAPAEI